MARFVCPSRLMPVSISLEGFFGKRLFRFDAFLDFLPVGGLSFCVEPKCDKLIT
jgi:hypothetical protein